MRSEIPKKSEACIGVDVLPMLKQLNVIGGVSIQAVEPALHEIIASGNYSIKPRFMLEKSTTELHFIPYIKITTLARDQVMIYQRPARDDGEARLDGMFSIGLGGHPDSKALNYDREVLNLDQSLFRAAWQEFAQEIGIHLDNDGEITDITKSVLQTLQPIGFIYDPSDDVGLTHVAVLFEAVAPPDAIFTPNSPTEVRDPRWVDVYDAIHETNDGFENWSRLWIKQTTRALRTNLNAAIGG